MNIHCATVNLAGLVWENFQTTGRGIFIRNEWMITSDNTNWYITKSDARYWTGSIKEYTLDDVGKIAKEFMFIVEKVQSKETNKPQNVSVGVYKNGNDIQVWCARFTLRGDFKDSSEVERRVAETLKQVDFGSFRKE